MILENVLYVPGLTFNLISCSKMSADGYNVTFGTDYCNVYRNDRLDFKGYVSNGLYYIQATTPSRNRICATAA